MVVLLVGPLNLSEGGGLKLPVDLPGLGLVSAGLFAIVFGLVRGSEQSWGSEGVAGHSRWAAQDGGDRLGAGAGEVQAMLASGCAGYDEELLGTPPCGGSARAPARDEMQRVV